MCLKMICDYIIDFIIHFVIKYVGYIKHIDNNNYLKLI